MKGPEFKVVGFVYFYISPFLLFLFCFVLKQDLSRPGDH